MYTGVHNMHMIRISGVQNFNTNESALNQRHGIYAIQCWSIVVSTLLGTYRIIKISRTSVARTLMARLPRLFRTRF